MIFRCILFVALLFPTIAAADHYLRTGKYLCELGWNTEGSQREYCVSRTGEEYSCLGFQLDLSEKQLSINTRGGGTQYKKISEHYGLFGDGEHVISMVFVDLFSNGNEGQHLVTLNYVHDERNMIHLKMFRSYDTTSFKNLTADEIKADPFLIYTGNHFHRCEWLQ